MSDAGGQTGQYRLMNPTVWFPATNVRVGRRVVLMFAFAALIAKLLLAATTFGTNDVHSWIDFARGMREFGFYDMYGHEYFTSYNHPPFSGVLLLAVNWLVDAGVSDVPFLIRGLSSVADVVTAVVVFELVRLHRSVGQAVASGVLISISPALIVISGFHGNTDPIFVMLSMVAAYLAARDRAFSAGVAIGLAISVKLIPIVVVPVLGVWLLRSGWRSLRAFASGGVVVFVMLWVPVLIANGSAFRQDVLGYVGSPWRIWGLPQLMTWAGMPVAWTDALVGPGRFVVLLVCGLVPAALVWREPRSFVPAVGLSLVLFLLLSPAFGMQYLSWAIAAAYLIGVLPASAYNLAASLFVLRVYSEWSGGGGPWAWDEAVATFFDQGDERLMIVSWVGLAWVAAAGVWAAVQGDEEPTAELPVARVVRDRGSGRSTSIAKGD